MTEATLTLRAPRPLMRSHQPCGVYVRPCAPENCTGEGKLEAWF